jgi:cytochrome c oxidase assembly protein subunit 11
MSKPTQHKNKRTALIVSVTVAGMIGLSYASVPLYQLFCQVTGYGGTTQVAEKPLNGSILERQITVSFDSNVASGLAWSFKPVQNKLTVRVGEETLAFYEARNDSDETITGTATFNVTPFKAGQYFAKVDCFCFTEQTLKPGQVVSMPVSFFIDPQIAADKNAQDVEDIVLSYTFFRSEKKPVEPVIDAITSSKVRIKQKDQS